MNKSQYKIVALTALGGALEFYDFTIYALFASYISQHFFPNTDKLVGLINTFSVFALGYFARPLGGIVFGYLGDKYGRKIAFALAVFMMASATLLMGCLPTYQSIGPLAPLLLILLRLIQGFSVGGEIPGAAVFILEHVPVNKRGFSIGFVFMCITLGNTLGAIVGLLLTKLLSPEQMMQWGWRIPFIIGFCLGFISYIIRKHMAETPVFSTLMQEGKLHANPFYGLWAIPKRNLLKGFFITASTSSIISLFLYLPTYLSSVLNLSLSYIYQINIISFLLFAIFTAIFGYLSDRILRERLPRVGASLIIISSYFLFYKLHQEGISFIWVFIFLISLGGGMINGSYVVTISSIFPANLKYSAVGLSYSLGVAVFAGTSPLIFTWLIQQFQMPEAPAFYLILSAFVTFIALNRCEKNEAVSINPNVQTSLC